MKGVKRNMSSPENSETSPTDTNSVDAVPARYRLVGYGVEPLRSKCNKCNAVTTHEWFRVTPSPQFKVEDVMEEMKNIRRVVMCTQCANLSLKQ